MDEDTQHYTVHYLRGAPNGQPAIFVHKDCPCTRIYDEHHEEGELLLFDEEVNEAECNNCDWKGNLTDEHWEWIHTWYAEE